jgi:hypothetical protein
MKQLFKLLLVYIAFGFLMFSLLSCDPIKRHARLVSKFPHVHTSVTKTIHDTVRINSVSKDTVFYHEFDTIIMTKERLRVQLIRSRDSIYLQGECDSIVIPKQYTYNEYSSTKVRRNWMGYLTLILIILLILVIFRANLKR